MIFGSKNFQESYPAKLPEPEKIANVVRSSGRAPPVDLERNWCQPMDE